jgi:hypothetical protein
MATTNYLYRSTRETANLTLRLLFTHNEKAYVFGANTKFEVSKSYWSKLHKKKTKDISIVNQQTELNNELNKLTNHVLTAFNKIAPDEVTKEWLQKQIDCYYNPPMDHEANKQIIPINLPDYIDYYKEARRHDLKPVIVKRCNVIKSKLKKYEADTNTKILIENVNDDFRNSFLDFQKKNKYALSTIKRELVFIKTLCTHAKMKGLKVSLELDKFSKEVKTNNLETANKTFVYLNPSDLNKLETLNPSLLTKSQQDVKNWLLISCYTGQRVSDFMRFNNSMIVERKERKFLEFTQVKTGVKILIPLHTKIIEILKNNNNNFPKPISDVKYNKYVKEVCRIAKIDEVIAGGKVSNVGTEKNPVWRKDSNQYKKYELVSSHIGRRSFATNNFGLMPTSLLKTFTGHKTEKQLLSYVQKTEIDMMSEAIKYF